MKILAANNTINFGYNKELNDKVNKKLKNAKGNKELANSLLELNKFCMRTEDKIREAENKHRYGLANTYISILMRSKIELTNVLNRRFPALNYRQTEIDTYKKEIDTKHHLKKGIWIKDLVDGLEFEKELDEMFDEIGNIRANKSNENIEKVVQAKPQQNVKSEQKECKYAELFIPTEFSPKGFESLGGMEEIKEALQDKIINPLKYPHQAKLDEIEYGIKAPRGELFYGPPGCGKTSIIEALAQETQLPLYKLKISKAGSIYVNGSALNTQEAYDYVKNVAKQTGKPVLFAIDEMESMTSKRSSGSSGSSENNKLVGTLLQIIEEARGNNVIILASTNNFDMVDDAIRSRFDDKIYLGLPNAQTREKVLTVLLNKISKGKALASDKEELAKVVSLTQGFSNRDLAILTDKAALIARKDGRRDVCADDYIVPVKENQNMKVKEDNYRDNTTRPSSGFHI